VDSVDCSALTVIIQENILVQCAGDLGEIQAIATGGIPPYNYNWDNGVNTDINPNLPVGTYTVTVTDAFGCEFIMTHSLSESDPLVLIPNALNETFNGAADGQASVNVTGGTPPYNYNWSNGSTNELLTNLNAGQYEVTVTDLNGCTSNIVVTVETDPVDCSSLSLVILETQTILCSGGLGDLQAVATGGLPPYSYSWDNGVTTEHNPFLPVGTYTATVTDSLGCVVILTYNLIDPTPLFITPIATNVYSSY